jgi:gliding motility-associated-like protein/uncharacterized repeat protein (TIGR01451 family)
LNTLAINPADVTLKVITPDSTGFITLNPDGSVDVKDGAPAGTYQLTYQICEKADNGNCHSATVSITVTAAKIIAQDDTIGGGNGAAGNANAGNVLNNNGNGTDTLNGVNVAIAQVNLAITTPATSVGGAPVPVVNTATGQVSVPAGTPAGNYTIGYSICEKLNPSNCDPAIVTVSVIASPIVLQNDDIFVPESRTVTRFLPISDDHGNGVDTINGVKLTFDKVIVTVTDIVLPSGQNYPVPNVDAATKEIIIPANTPAGVYHITYQVCEKLNPTNCSTAVINITVAAAVIDAVNDDYSSTPIPSFEGGTTASVITNDTLNTLPAVLGTLPGQVKLTSITVPTGLTLNADGTIKVASNTPAGTYTVTYTICGVLNSGNCDTATAKLVVSAQTPSIALVKTATAVDENGDGFASAGENIRYNFTITNTGNVPLTNITISDLLPGLVLTGGPITLLAGQQDTNSFVGIYKITQTDANNEMVANQASVSGTSPLGTIVKDLSDNYSNIKDDATVLSVKNCVVEVNNALTPNGDGLNEYFHIEGLDCFSNNTVEIYNRWGVLVFETSKYNNVDNVFDGHSRGRVTINQSEGLPDGTYYYVLKYVDFSGNGVQKAGYLYLKR